MTKLLLLTLLLNPMPALANDHYCEEIIEILRENVRDGYISVIDARRIANRCSNDLFKD